MTTPVAHGFPDYGRYASRADTLYIDDAQNTAATITYGPFFVGSIEYVALKFTTAGNGAQLWVQFSDTSPIANNLGSTIYEVFAAASLPTTIPVAAPYMQIKVVPQGGACNYSLLAWHAASPLGQFLGNGNVAELIRLAAQNVNAGVTSTFTAADVVGGLCSWNVFPLAAGNFEATLTVLDSLGATNFYVDEVNQATYQYPRLTALPQKLCRLVIHNASAGAMTFNASVNVLPSPL